MLFKLNKAPLPQIYSVLMSSQPKAPHTPSGTNSSNDSTKLTISKVRQAMLVLLQHNCLFVDPPEVSLTEPVAIGQTTKKPLSPGSTYSLDSEMIINRLRFPAAIQNIYKTLRILAALVASEVLFNGKLRLTDILSEVFTRVEYKVKSIDNSHVAASSSHYTKRVSTSCDILTLASDSDLQHLCTLYRSDKLKAAILEKFTELFESRWVINVLPPNSHAQINSAGIDTSSSGIGSANEGVHRRGGDSWFQHKNLEAPAAGKTYNRSRGLKDIFATSTQSSSTTKKSATLINIRPAEENNLFRDAEFDPQINADSQVKATATSTRKRGATSSATSESASKSSKRGRPAATSTTTSTASAAVSNSSAHDKSVSLCFSSSSALVLPTNSVSINADISATIEDFDLDSVWTINFNTFFLFERRELCIQAALERIGKLGSEIVSVLFSPSKTLLIDSSSTADSIDGTIKLSILQLTSEVNNIRQISNSASLSIVDRQSIKASVEALCTDNAKFLIKDPFSSSEQYSVNIRGIIGYLRQQAINKVVSDRHHPYASRIVQLLSTKRYLEQQAISDMIVAPPRDTRHRIYELYRNGWIDVHEVCKKTDFSPSSTQYYWYTTQAHLMTNLLENLYISLVNVKLRRQVEVENMDDSIEYSAQETQELAEQLAIQQKVLTRLDSAIFKIDKTLQLCSRF